MPKEKKIQLLDRIYWATEWTNFAATKFNTVKRFGIDGMESFIPGTKAALDAIYELGA